MSAAGSSACSTGIPSAWPAFHQSWSLSRKLALTRPCRKHVVEVYPLGAQFQPLLQLCCFRRGLRSHVSEKKGGAIPTQVEPR